MDFLPKSLKTLIEELALLPGLGPKSAQRLAFHLLKRSSERNAVLGGAVVNLQSDVLHCETCHSLACANPCSICNNSLRDQSQLCIVESTLDLIAIEKTGGYKGFYHVLGGRLSPLEGVGPEDLKIMELFERMSKVGSEVQEVILALNPDLEGDTTTLFLQRKLSGFSALKITRIARGLPTGGHLEYTDETTLIRALEGRHALL